MVVGVIAILLALLIPYLRRSVASARATAGTAVIRSTSSLILLYQQDFKDVFPISSRFSDPVNAGRDYFFALRKAGLINGLSDVDPWFEKRQRQSTQMAQSLLMDASLMRPGYTVPLEEFGITGNRLSDLAFPSYKGQLVLGYTEDPRNGALGYWCCYSGAPRSSVAFCDGSVGEYFWYQLLPDETFYIENGLGTPVYTTWGGVKGRDR